MDLRQLRYFSAVVDHGGFARASVAINVSQPAVSASVAQLEQMLGLTLLERGAFGARPTEAGRQLHARAQLILSDLRRAGEEMAVLRDGEGGSVSVGIGPLFEHTIMPRVLADFVVKHPKVSVTTSVGVTSELLEPLARGELDFVASSPTGWLDAPAGVAIKVLQETHDILVAAASHPLWLAGDFSLRALAAYPWIVTARVDEAARGFFAEFAEAGVVAPATLVRTDSIPILRELVLDRGFLCVVSPHFASLLFARGHQPSSADFRIVPCEAFKFPRRLCLATRVGGAPLRAAALLMAMVRAACASEFK